ncbi:hypothetical protein ACFQVC_09975 [Streptomyces monticola]|uniref:DUF3098 domain-containing protein n=1 Tax=Streptomyces monticola TaxID=2666263 RepID=A0ABW2JES7_9ACTN
MKSRTSAVGFLVAIFVFFLGLLISGELKSSDGSLMESVPLYLAIAVPGGLLAAWIASRGRR